MLNPKLFLLLSLLVAGISQAEELAIEAKPFEIIHTLDAKVMPSGEVPQVQIDPKAWQSFSITALTEHGSAVNKGDLLVSFDAREIDKKLASLKRQIESKALTLSETEDRLARLQETKSDRLEAAKRAAAEAAEQLDYFTKTGRKAEEDEARHSIKRTEQYVANEKEELRQLKQMYEADDLTEDTEEIILTRQIAAVEHAEFMLRLSKLSNTRELEVLIPRKANSLAEAARNTAVALNDAEASIPREIEQTKLQLESLKAGLEEDRLQLADLVHDRQFFEIKAPADGIFYHGAIADGRWTTGELLRGLRVGGSAPLHTSFASLVPGDAELSLVAHTVAAMARQLTKNNDGVATLAGTQTEGAKLSSIALKVAESRLVPDLQGKYQVTLKPTWPEGLNPAVGNPATVHVLVYQQDEAIVVPAKAVEFGAKGWSVELKLADGKTERRPVVRGAQSGDEVEILSGLEVGQVIITP